MGFPDGSDGKESACNAEDPDSIPGSERYPGEGNGYSFRVLACGIPWTERNLAGYSSWGPKELDMTERLTLSHFLGNNYILEKFI